MPFDAILWLYIVCFMLLILHEMDSAYWKEWELFRIPGGIAVFLLLHLPLYGIGFAGVVLLARSEPAGMWFACLVSAAGLAAFGIHTYFLRRGHAEFNTPASRLLLAANLVGSLSLLAIVVAGWAGIRIG
jgi:hypothetical protein